MGATLLTNVKCLCLLGNLMAFFLPLMKPSSMLEEVAKPRVERNLKRWTAP